MAHQTRLRCEFARPRSFPLDYEKILNLLREAANQLVSENPARGARTRRAIKLFRPVLRDWCSAHDQIDGEILEQFQAHLRKNRYTIDTSQKYVGDMRFVSNQFLLPKGLLQKPFTNLLTHRREERRKQLPEHTLKAIEWFEQNACCVKSSFVFAPVDGVIRKSLELAVTRKPLASGVIRKRVSRLIQFLNQIQKTDVREVAVRDGERYIQDYQDRGQKTSAQKSISELIPVFQNLKQGGFVSENPLLTFLAPAHKSNAVVDFITLEDVEKLLNLESICWQDPIGVRNRMIALLFYDLAVRRKELTQFMIDDIRIEDEDHVLVTVRPEIQKGQDKDEVQFFLFFPSTRRLVREYLTNLRARLKPKDKHLLISERGEPLSYTYVAAALRQVFNRLRVRTFKGKEVTPHILRHSFATLNIAPLGLKLSLDDIVDRLRHVGYEVAKKHYVHDNYYLKRAKLKCYAAGAKKTVFGQVTVEDVTLWLRSLRVSGDALSEVVSKFIVSKESREIGNSEWIKENNVLDRLKRFNFSAKVIRPFFERSDNHRIERFGKEVIHRYPKDIVEELQFNYETPEILMKTLNIAKGTFYNRVDKFKTLKIGRTLLVRKDSIFSSQLGIHRDLEKNTRLNVHP